MTFLSRELTTINSILFIVDRESFVNAMQIIMHFLEFLLVNRMEYYRRILCW